MDVITGPIHLDRQADGVELEPADWQKNPDAETLWHHRPTHTIWQVMLNDDVDRATTSKVTPFHFHAMLSHVCDGHPVPSDVDLTELGRAAIVMCLEEFYPGIFGLNTKSDDDIPF